MSIIDGVKLLETLSQSEKDNLSLFCQEKVLKAGEVLFDEWDEWNAMYLLKSWEIEISKKIDYKDAILGTVQAEEIIWEMAIFWESNKRMAKAKAMIDCELITILSFSIKELTQKSPELLEKIKNIITQRNDDNKMKENSIK